MQLSELQMEWKRGLALQYEFQDSRADEVTHFRVSRGLQAPRDPLYRPKAASGSNLAQSE